jgi:hypothetical protein
LHDKEVLDVIPCDLQQQSRDLLCHLGLPLETYNECLECTVLFIR